MKVPYDFFIENIERFLTLVTPPSTMEDIFVEMDGKVIAKLSVPIEYESKDISQILEKSGFNDAVPIKPHTDAGYQLKWLYPVTDLRGKNMSPIAYKWIEIGKNLFSLSLEPYIDDQIELDAVWSITGDIVQSGMLTDSPVDIKKIILSDTLSNRFYDDMSAYDPMYDMYESADEANELEYADVLISSNNHDACKIGLYILKKHGQIEKYNDALRKDLAKG